MAKQMVVHSFYADGNCVWRAEWYERFSVERLKEEAEKIKELGYGDVEFVTDTTGRHVSLKQ